MRQFELPKLDYFLSGNPFGGSVWDEDFTYAVCPEEGALVASYWYGAVARPLAENIVSESFSLDDDGIAAAADWLAEQFSHRKRFERVNLFTYLEQK